MNERLAFVVVISDSAMADLERLSGERGADPYDVAAKLIENALAKNDIAKAILGLGEE